MSVKGVPVSKDTFGIFLLEGISRRVCDDVILAITLVPHVVTTLWLSGEPDYFGRNKISSGGDLSHYSSASLY